MSLLSRSDRGAGALLVLALLVVTLVACGETPSPEPSALAASPARPTVSTLSFPAQWLVERLAGDLVDAGCVLPAGEDAPYWQPSAELVASLAEADLIVANGAGFEAWMQTSTLPEERVVLSAAGVETIEIAGETHSHGPGGEHTHGGTDPHTWSDPLTYLLQAEEVAGALSRLVDAAGEQAIADRLETLRAELESLDASYREVLAPLAGVPMAANHPAFNYVARRYDLDIESLELDPERAPEPDELAPFEAWASGKPAPILLWEAAPLDAARKAFAAEVRHFVLDPLEQPGETGTYDYLAQARANLDTWRSLASE